MSMMSSAVAVALDTIRTVTGRTVTYSDGTNSVTLDATPSQRPYEVVDADGFQVWVRPWEFLITAADLVLDGSVVEPAAGHTIAVAEGGVTRTYEVQAFGSLQPFEPADPARLSWRVRTRLVDSE
jgi:hypothetical protein